MKLRYFFAILYLLTASCYTILGTKVLSKYAKNRSNILYFLACISVAIWSFSFGMADFSDTLEQAITWHQISSIGWSFFCPLLFLLILSLKKSPKIENKLVYFYTLLPGFINLTIHLLLGDFSRKNVHVIQNDYGFVHTQFNTFGNYYFAIFMTIFSLLMAFELYLWRKDILKNKSVYLYFSTENFFPAIIIGMATSIIAEPVVNSIFNYEFPQISVFILVLPAVSLYKMAEQKKIMNKTISDFEKLNSKRDYSESLFEIIGITKIVYGFITFGINYLTGPYCNLESLPLSILFIIVGICHFFTPKLIKKVNNRYTVFTFSTIIFIVCVDYMYKDIGSVVIWALFFVFLIASFLFEERGYSLIIISSMIISQFYFILVKPEFDVEVNWINYFMRIIIIVFIYAVSSYVNSYFKQRFNEADKHIDIQIFLNKISRTLLYVDKENIRSIIKNLIENIIIYFGFMRGVLYKYDKKNKIYYKFVSKDNKNIQIPKNTSDDIIPAEKIPWLHDKFINNRSVNAPNIMILPEEALNEKNFFLSKNILGLIAHPVFEHNELVAFFIFEFDKIKEDFLYADFFKIITGLLENSLEKIKNDEELFLTANYDLETGFMNRLHFESKIKNYINTTEKKQDIKIAIFHVAIDGYKSFNKVFGEKISLEITKKVGSALISKIPENSFLCLFGDGEFMISVMDYEDENSLESKAKKILDFFSKPITLNNIEISVPINIGISIYPEDGKNEQELIKNVSLALFKAKRLGKNKYSFTSEIEKKNALETLRYQNKLYDAVRKKHFVLAYQPQVDSSTSKVVGAEALIRWNDPEEGIIPPFKFIDLLERTGLIIELGKWIVSESLSQIEKIKKLGYDDFKISVNLSPVQFLDDNLIENIKTSLENSSVDPKNLELEITETVAEHGKLFDSIEKFNALKKLGVKISIDDFGTGYSSLNRIQALPIDKIKIDKSFIDGIGVDAKKESIIEIIINLAKVLNAECISEGVEEKYQLDFLKSKDSYLIQGYYYSKPLFEKDFIEYIKSNS